MTVALVTGANKGIGFATARLLCQQGANVWIRARSVERGRAAEAALPDEGSNARFIQVDVTDANSMAAAVSTISADEPALDILVNNAGIMAEMHNSDFATRIPPSQASRDLLRSIFETNFFGPVAVI